MASMQSFTPKFVKPFSAMVCGRVRIHMTTGCARGRFPRREPHPVGNSREATGGCQRPISGASHGTPARSEEHTSELQSLMRIAYAVFCLQKTTPNTITHRAPIKLTLYDPTHY